MSGDGALPGDGASDPSRAGDGPDLARVAWLAAHFGRPFSTRAVQARLPARADMAEPATLAKALAAVGLKSRLVHRRPRRLDAAVLPALVFVRDGPPVILTGFDARRRHARLVVSGEGPMEREESLRTLARRATGEVLFVSLADDLAERRLSHGAEPAEGAGGHWFRTPLRQNAGALAQVVVAALGINLLGLALPLFVMNVYDRVIPNLAFVTLWTLALGVGLAIGVELLLRATRAALLERLGRRLDTAIASSLFAQALRLRPADLPGGTAAIANHIRDFETVREFFASATFVAAIDLLFIGVFLYVLWLIVGPLALVPLLAVPAVLAIAGLAQLTVGRSLTRAQALAGRKQAVLTETLGALDTVKSVGAEPVFQREWDRASAASARVSGRARFWSQVSTNATQVILQVVSVAIIVWGVFLVAEGRITIGALIAANILSSRALAPLGTIAQTVFRAQYALRAMSALSAFMGAGGAQARPVTTALAATRGAVELRKVSLCYPGATAPALDAVSLAVSPGETVALVGRVGSGKSTLGRVMAGLASPESGTLLLDGHGYGQYDAAELRAAVGYLPQEPELFTGTLRENLTVGRPAATEEEIARALRLAAMDRFVAERPEGLDLFLGERGAALSGGQRQGVALARLFLRRPRLIFLDEPSAAMDREMEAAFAARLRDLAAEGTGLVLCTHRPSLAAIAARMVVLEAGRILLDGPRETVMARLQGMAADAPPKAAE